MRNLLFLMLLPLAACSSWHRAHSAPDLAASPDSLQADLEFADGEESDLRVARWHLLRALEARSCSLFTLAQQELDLAAGILAALESSEASPTEILHMDAAIESAYLQLLPHLEHFSPNSSLVLLLEGLSEEKIENLPPDATQLVRIHQLSQRCDMPIDANAKVAASIHFFQTRGRATFETWMRRSGRFRELILDILRQEGVPEDLFYIAMIESGFNPRAYSRARAVGLWQFIAGTGKLQGLRRTHWLDERRDPFKSTRAAARHLKGLQAHFQDWRLSIAAYNSGKGRVSRAMARDGTRDFWQLDLPRETENYVPLFMAAAVIAKDPELFGFSLKEFDAPFAFDEIPLPADLPYVDLKVAASALGISYATLRDLNPELRQRITPPRSGRKGYHLRVPPGKGDLFLKRYASLPQSDRPALYKYVIQPRDNLSSIANAFGVGSRLIAEANSITNPNRIFPGQVIYVPTVAGARAPSAHEKQVHTVRSGDSLSGIAQRYGVRLRDLLQWNHLTTTLIRPGQQLVVWKPKATTPARPKIELDAEGLQRHTVQSGETLWGLSRAFDVSVAQLQEWNQLQNALIRPGQQLVVSLPLKARDEGIYTVMKGDTLYSIALKFGLHARDIARQNNISLSTTLLAGTTLKIGTRSQN